MASTELDSELHIIKQLIEVFVELPDAESRQRVLDYLQSRFGDYPEVRLKD